MANRLALLMCALCASVLMSRSGIASQAPLPRPIQLTLPAYGSARSPAVNVRAGETVAIRPARLGELIPAIFVYDDTHALIAKNDETRGGGVFEWTAPRETSLQIVIYSNSDRALDYSIEVLPPAPTRGSATAPTHAVVRVLFATDRRIETRRPLAFDSEPADGNQISYGTCLISVPRDHRMGELEGPSIWRLEFRPDPERHVLVLSKELSDQARFFDEVRHLAERSDDQDALVFVHGYNVEFDDAARRTAQLAYDLGFKGPAIAFSWPSQATLTGYNRDARNVELSADSLRAVLSDLAKKANVKRIHVIAHSMGNRALVGALSKIANDVPVRQIALIAPDIDAELFRRLARNFPSSIGPITLYASSRDAALIAAATFAGYPRAGQGGQDIVVTPGIDTVDASAVDTSLTGLGHSYYADASQMLSDLFAFFGGNPASKRFGLRAAQSKDGPYWIFAPVAR
jgi:esterase/lipase superfamily enzyme